MNYFIQNTHSPFGRMDIRIKMTLGFAISLLIVLVDTPLFLGVCAASSITCFCLCYPNRSQILLVFTTTCLIVWGLMFSQGFFYSQEPKQVLFVFCEPNWFFKNGLKVYVQGLYHGALQSLRMVAASLIGFAICFSTDPDQFLKGLLALRVPFSLSFMAVCAIRFIPIVAQEIVTVRQAMRLKGYRLFIRGFGDTILTEIAILRPILAGTIRRSQEIALSIQTRGFSITGKRSSWKDDTFTLTHAVIIGVMVIGVSLIGIAKILFWLYQWEIYYSPELRPLYGFVRSWL